MRKAYCLMYLGRYGEARKIFESEIIQAALGQFNIATLYDYFSAYGNTLGNLGLIDRMNEVMTKAVKIASEDLGDLKKCENVWYWMLYWLKEQKHWKRLEKECINAF